MTDSPTLSYNHAWDALIRAFPVQLPKDAEFEERFSDLLETVVCPKISLDQLRKLCELVIEFEIPLSRINQEEPYDLFLQSISLESVDSL